MKIRSNGPRCGVASLVVLSACAAPPSGAPTSNAEESPGAAASAFVYFGPVANAPVAHLVSPRGGGTGLRICLAGDGYRGEPAEARAKADGLDTSPWRTRDEWRRFALTRLRPWIDAAQGASNAPLVTDAEITFGCDSAAFEISVSYKGRPCTFSNRECVMDDTATGLRTAWLGPASMDITLFHELGHIFGLGDSYVEGTFVCRDNEEPSIMCGHNSVNGALTSSDVAGVQRTFCDAAPAACDESSATGIARADGSLEVAYRDGTHQPSRLRFDGTRWTASLLVDEPLMGDPVLVRNGGELRLYGVSRDDDPAYYQTNHGTTILTYTIEPATRRAYSTWRRPMGGIAAVSLDASAASFALAHRDPGGNVMYYEDHPSYGTSSIAVGIVSTSTPALVLDAAGEPHVLGTAADGRLLHAWRSGGVWRNEAVSARTPSGGVYAETSEGTPAVARAADGSLVVLARQPMSIERLVLTGGSWSVRPLPQQVFAESGVRAVSAPNGNVEAFAVDTTSRLVRVSISATGTTITRTESGRVYGTPGVVVSPSGRLDVFARGVDGLLWQKSIQSGESPWIARDEALSQIKNGSSGLCLEATRGAPAGPYDTVIATTCSDRETQRWYRRPSLSSGYGLKSRVRGVDGMCVGLDVPGDFGTVGRKLALRPCMEDADQALDFDRPDAPGTDKLSSFNSCTGPGAEGQSPVLVQCTGDAQTEWRFVP